MQRKNFLIIIKYLLFQEIAIIANKLQVVVQKIKQYVLHLLTIIVEGVIFIN